MSALHNSTIAVSIALLHAVSVTASAQRHDFNALRSQLWTTDSKTVQSTIKELESINSKEAVNLLIELALTDYFAFVDRNVTTPGDDQVVHEAPPAEAIKALSKIVPNPPMTYTTRRWFGNMYLERELWEGWWETEKSAYEGLSGPIPAPPKTSLRLKPEEDRIKIEEERLSEIQIALGQIMRRFNQRMTTDSHAQLGKVIDEYLAEKRVGRAEKKAAALQSKEAPQTGQPAIPHSLNERSEPPPSAENPTLPAADEPEKSNTILYVALGILVVAIVVVVFHKARNQ